MVIQSPFFIYENNMIKYPIKKDFGTFGSLKKEIIFLDRGCANSAQATLLP